MASDAQEILYKLFADVARNIGQSSEGALIGGQSESAAAAALTPTAPPSLTSAIGSPVGAAVSASGVMVNNSGGSSQNQNDSGDGGSSAERIALDVLKSGFGLAPLVSTLFGLFGGDNDTTPPPLTKYVMPQPLELRTAVAGSGFQNADYNQTGTPRGYDAPIMGTAPTIQVSVQAMDARSFLDRSSEIAAAVRDAMLNLNPINDVVNDL